MIRGTAAPFGDHHAVGPQFAQRSPDGLSADLVGGDKCQLAGELAANGDGTAEADRAQLEKLFLSLA